MNFTKGRGQFLVAFQIMSCWFGTPRAVHHSNYRGYLLVTSDYFNHYLQPWVTDRVSGAKEFHELPEQ
jgi:hypothetical protein